MIRENWNILRSVGNTGRKHNGKSDLKTFICKIIQLTEHQWQDTEKQKTCKTHK